MHATSATNAEPLREARAIPHQPIGVLFISVAVLGFIAFAPAAVAQTGEAAGAPVISTFEPTSGPTGSHVLVHGSGFSAEDSLFFGGLSVAFALGEGVLGFTVPEIGPMDHSIEITGTRGYFGTCCFTVTESSPPASDPEPTTSEPEPGTTSGSAGGCAEAGKNMQCNAFGQIAQDFQRDIKGERITITTTITLDTSYAERDARWILFSVRNNTGQSSSPVTLSLVEFETAHGDILTTDIEKPSPNEINIWVHVIDVPVETPITLTVDVGASERGAFRLETLVLAFDRGYAPVQDKGQDASLFSFTLLGVNKETGSAPSAGASSVNRLPGFEVALAVSAITAAAVMFMSRRRAA